MELFACPQCGFQNFSMSAYCARCEQPLGETDPILKRPQTNTQLVRPSVLRIAMAITIDAVFCLAVSVIGTVVLWAVLGRNSLIRVSALFDRFGLWVHHNQDVAVLALLWTIAFTIAYHAVCTRRGTTLGRMATTIRLRRKSGKPMNLPFVLFRLSLAAASAACLGAGFFWLVLSKKNRTFHDWMTQCEYQGVKVSS